MTDPAAPRTGLALVLLVVLGTNWGITFSLAKIGQLGGIPPLGYAMWQSGAAGVILLGICAVRRIWPPLTVAHLRYYVVAALTGQAIPVVNMLLVVKHIPVGVFTLMVTMSPLLTYGLAMALRMEAFSLRRFGGMLLGFTGMLFILLPRASLPSPDMLPWVLMALITPAFFAGSNVYIAKARPPGVDSLALGAAMQLTVGVLLLPVAAATGGLYLLLPPFASHDLALLAHIGAATLGALLMFEIIRLAGVVFMSQVAYIVTLNGIVWGMYFFDEHHSAWIWAALACIVTGVVLVTKAPARLRP